MLFWNVLGTIFFRQIAITSFDGKISNIPMGFELFAQLLLDFPFIEFAIRKKNHPREKTRKKRFYRSSFSLVSVVV